MFDFGYLLIIAVALVISWWPIGAWHLWSIMWAVILLTVLIFEAISKFLSPDKKTISDVARNYRKEHPVIFWTLQLTLWIVFAWALAVHLAN